MEKKSYTDYRFLGVKSFLKSLEDSGTEHMIFDDEQGALWRAPGEILKEDDRVITGMILRDDRKAFFAEFGIRITKSYHSHIVFIFDHHPALSELEPLLGELEGIVMKGLEGIDLSLLSGPPGGEPGFGTGTH